MSARRYFLAIALFIGACLVATIGWIDHWNTYVNLMLLLVALVCYVAALVAIARGAPSGKARGG